MAQSILGPIGQLSRSVADIAAAEAWWRDVSESERLSKKDRDALAG